MKSLLLLILPACLSAAPALQVVKPVISLMEGGTADPPGYAHIPGETLFFTCRVANYTASPEHKVHLAYSVQAFDPKGLPLAEVYKNEMQDEVTPQDKEWQPKIATALVLPPLAASGVYKIVVKVDDVVATASAELSVSFEVHGRDVPPSDTLAVRNFRFYRGEDEAQPLETAAYRPGDSVWVRFDLVGFRYGPNNRTDVSYSASILGASGKVLWSQAEPAVEQSESFYPKQYIPASMEITLQRNVRPGEYTIAVAVKDEVGSQSSEVRGTFRVE